MNKKIGISIGIIAVLLLYVIIANVRHSPDVPDLSLPDGAIDEILITAERRDDQDLQEGREMGRQRQGISGRREADRGDREAVPGDPAYGPHFLQGVLRAVRPDPGQVHRGHLQKEGKVIQEFKIGKKSSTNRHTFVKIDDRPEIYLAEGTFDIVMNRTQDDFRDREVLKIKPDAVSAFTVNYQGREFVFTKEAARKPDAKDAKEANKERRIPAASGGSAARFPTSRLTTGRMNSFSRALTRSGRPRSRT